MNRIHDSLRHVFQRHRLVFWYDPEGQWILEFETFKDDGIHKRRIEGTKWGTKVAIHRDPDPHPLPAVLSFRPSPGR
ncbi:MAG: hypothetical protein RKR03_10275 [Candidatus Competibacter sp.]|nr:hypothetical protein [Candidatus Competibacter sp.]